MINPLATSINLLEQYHLVINHFSWYLREYRSADVQGETLDQLFEKQAVCEASLWHKLKAFDLNWIQHDTLCGAFDAWVRLAELNVFEDGQAHFFLSKPHILTQDHIKGAWLQLEVHNIAANAILTKAGHVDKLSDLKNLIERNIVNNAVDSSTDIIWNTIQMHLAQLSALLSGSLAKEQDSLWNSIDSAPKDGSTILAYDAGKSGFTEDGVLLVKWSIESQLWILALAPELIVEHRKNVIDPLMWQDKPKAPCALLARTA